MSMLLILVIKLVTKRLTEAVGSEGSGCVSGSRFNRIAHTRETMYKDGFNSLKYQVVSVEKLDLFTKITVDVGRP